MAVTIAKLSGGSGRITVASHGLKAIFSELSSTYPLKLLSPRAFDDSVALVYLLTYGGGLVSGDQVNLAVEVQLAAKLVLLSQGSTKVFKTRPGRRMARVEGGDAALPGTTQTMTFTVSALGGLFLLPDPVTCFRSASYNQIQTFHLSPTSSAAILDWITSGRKSLGEDWAFSRYYSVNEIFLDGKRVALDAMLLDSEDTINLQVQVLPSRSLAQRLAPYSCYATLFLFGPMLQSCIHNLTLEYDKISVMKARAPEGLIWSLSPLKLTGHGHGDAVVVRVAGKETEAVKRWIGEALRPLEAHVGLDAFRQAFP